MEIIKPQISKSLLNREQKSCIYYSTCRIHTRRTNTNTNC